MSSDELEKLAAEGRARKAAAASREQEAKSGEERSRQQEHLDVLYGSVSAYARWGWFLLAFPAGALIALTVAKVLPSNAFLDGEDDRGGIGMMIVICAFFLGFLVTRPLRPFFGRRGVAREEAWLAKLPFPLVGYLQTLEGPANDGTLTLGLAYEDSAPKDLDFVADVLSASGGRVAASGQGHEVSMRFEWESSPSTNVHVVEWVHRVAPTLIALHGKWRLKHVAVRASWH